MSDRKSTHEIDKIFIERWSPRSFDSSFDLSNKDIEKLIEAARWSPSCFNEQPWRFYYALRGNGDFNGSLDWLVDANQQWAKNASALLFVVAKKTFSKNSKPNDHSWFDSGAAWMGLTMQARMLDLFTHGMAGIKTDTIHEKLQLSEDFEVVCAVAVGKKADPQQLSEDYQKMEEPNDRKALDDILFSI